MLFALMQPAVKRWRARIALGAAAAVLVGTAIVSWLAFIIPDGADIGTRDGEIGPSDVLLNGRLPPLPRAATDVASSYWTGVFTGAEYLRFRASEVAVREFVAAAGLKPSHCEPWARHDQVPDWFVPEQLDDPECFLVPADQRNHNSGRIWVRGDTVFVEIVWS